MKELEELYRTLISTKSWDNTETEIALGKLGQLIDISLDLQRTEGLKHAIKLSKALFKRELKSEHSATLHYYLSNAWANIEALSSLEVDQKPEWEQVEMEKGIFHLRSAFKNGFTELPQTRKCQILTNLANLYSNAGRFVEAIEYWNKALEILPSFAMAQGNKGIGLTIYAQALYDKGQAFVFLRYAHNNLQLALSSNLHNDAQKKFDKYIKWIESLTSSENQNEGIKMDNWSLGSSNQEIRYRRWCLENCLFLNPLNDLGPHSIAAQDILTTPPIVAEIGEGPYYQGYFNQLKQEFVSARYLYYESITATQPHFSDRLVLLYNTLDYPSYSLAVEKVKATFKVAYSLLDKIAYFLNDYLNLSIQARQISFKTFWYESQDRRNDLRENFRTSNNKALKGLFWLSKDLFEDKPGFKDAIEPDAKELRKIRNRLEHRYLKLHGDDWVGPSMDEEDSPNTITDTLAFSLYRRDFEAKTLRLLKLARSALIYLSLVIHCEERKRSNERESDSVIPQMPLDIWEDDWKV